MTTAYPTAIDSTAAMKEDVTRIGYGANQADLLNNLIDAVIALQTKVGAGANIAKPGEVALTDAATIATDASLGTDFAVTLGGNRTLGNPTNLVAGRSYTWRIVQDGTGNRTLAYGNAFLWPAGATPTLTTAAAAIDKITAYYDGAHLLANILKAYA